MKSLFLLADSQPFFWQGGEPTLVGRLRAVLDEGGGPVRCAYIGASNRDQPMFFELARAAVARAGVEVCRLIPSEPSDEDGAFLEQAEMVVLAGGDPALGWRVFVRHGWVDLLRARWAAGAVLVGVSAGAVQLGTMGWRRDPVDAATAFEALRLVPYLVDVHDDPSWAGLGTMLRQAPPGSRGLGIPRGGAAIVHADLTVEPLRRALTELAVENDEIRHALLVPAGVALE